ncbi:CPBP family intramembrane glutamic endopeptidase [Lacrimispora sp. 38-1]|uniref:CPBP family intramembrane glutamic endopeptidase n=1 Tax=Lacrimispora sp. 38-1 TaxID=3125778 RepID=UPI003CF1C499
MFKKIQKMKGKVLMIVIILHLILPLFTYTLATTFLYLAVPLGPLSATGLSAALNIPVLLWVYYYDQKNRGYSLAESFKLTNSPVSIWLLGAALCILGNSVVEVMGLTRISKAYQEAANALYSPPFALQLLASGFIIPAAEELIFRGMIFAPLRDKFSFGLSAVISAGLFGLYHGNLPQGVYAFLIGLAAAWLYERTKALSAAFMLHIPANLLSLFITNTKLSGFLFQRGHAAVTVAVVAAAVVVTVFCIVRIYWKNNLKEDIV